MPAGARDVAGTRGRLEHLEPPVGQPPLLWIRHQIPNLRFLGLEGELGVTSVP